MECSLEANPLPDIVWYQGTKTIIDTDRVKMSRKAISKDTYVLTLEILNPTRDDGGNYRCNAFNIYGESNANIALNFQGKSINQSVIMSRKLSLFAVFTFELFQMLNNYTHYIIHTHSLIPLPVFPSESTYFPNNFFAHFQLIHWNKFRFILA